MATSALHTIERSIHDFSTMSELKHVLSVNAEQDETLHGNWKLDNYDAETTIPNANDPELEAKRLQNLLDYKILDAPRNHELDELTRSAQEQFQVPMAAITLVDYGRQYFASLQGLEGVTETTRDIAFCAHTIRRKPQCTGGVMVIPDATQDVRFQDNDLVTGPMQLKFYAGAPIVSPEGYTLGALCLLDTKARPEGLCRKQQQNLKTMADCAMASILMM
jgi:hypothetical protein